MEHDETRSAFTEAELAILDANVLDSGPPGAGSVDLIVYWEKGVDRIEANLSAVNRDDPRTEGADDYIGILFNRDRVKRSLSKLPSVLRERLLEIVRRTDERFMALTVTDHRGLSVHLGSVERSADDWWWQRLPAAGFMRQDFEEYYLDRSGL